MRYRILVEVEYLLSLVELKSFQKKRSLSKKTLSSLRSLYIEFSDKDFKQIKKIESKTNHDVNAVVVFISEKLEKISRKDLIPLVHFGLTSEDINNTAYSLMTKGATKNIMVPAIKNVLKELKKLARRTKSLPMLSLTHGQPATTTTLGKELAVFISRIERELVLINEINLLAKFSEQQVPMRLIRLISLRLTGRFLQKNSLNGLVWDNRRLHHRLSLETLLQGFYILM